MSGGREESGAPQTFIEHLTELRLRIIYSLLGLVVGFAIAWFFRHDILFVLKKPLLDALPEAARHTILLRVMDKFIVHIKLAFYGALFLASPFILLQGWLFVAPGLYRSERRLVLPFALAGTMLFFVGVTFCYFVVLPFGFQFFVDYSLSGQGGGFVGTLIDAAGKPDMLQISLKEHIDFTARFLLAFGIAFESPLFMVGLMALGLVSPEKFAKLRPYAVVGIFVFAAILTPPDPWTQLSLGLPLLLLYEVAILIGKIIVKMRGGQDDEEDRGLLPPEAGDESSEAGTES